MPIFYCLCVSCLLFANAIRCETIYETNNVASAHLARFINDFDVFVVVGLVFSSFQSNLFITRNTSIDNEFILSSPSFSLFLEIFYFEYRRVLAECQLAAPSVCTCISVVDRCLLFTRLKLAEKLLFAGENDFIIKFYENSKNTLEHGQ